LRLKTQITALRFAQVCAELDGVRDKARGMMQQRDAEIAQLRARVRGQNTPSPDAAGVSATDGRSADGTLHGPAAGSGAAAEVRSCGRHHCDAFLLHAVFWACSTLRR
jgi:hypothetical protein